MRGAGAACGRRDRGMGAPERTRIAGQVGKAFEQAPVRWAREQCREQRIFARPRRLDVIDVEGRVGMFAVEIDRTVGIAHPVCSRSGLGSTLNTTRVRPSRLLW